MAAAAGFVSVLKDIKAGKYAPVYLLHGEEPYYAERIVEAIDRHVLTESEKAFNQTTLYGKDTDHKAVFDHCRLYPMMAQYRVVLLREAQMMKKEHFEALEAYLEKPAPTTVFVICYMHKKVDGRTTFMRTAKKHALVLEGKKLYEREVPGWIESAIRDRGLSVKSDAVQILYQYLGNDLSKIENEISKLVLNLKGQKEITKDIVHDHIGMSREYNVFELQKAVGMRDFTGTERIVKNLIANMKSAPLLMVTATFFGYFSKLQIVRQMARATDQEIAEALGQRSTYFLGEYKQSASKYSPASLEKIIGIIRDFDFMSRGINIRNKDDGQLLREMVQRIFYA